MIRIAYVINYIVKNGPSSVVLNLIDNLDRLEYDISLITLFEGNNHNANLHENTIDHRIWSIYGIQFVDAAYNSNRYLEFVFRCILAGCREVRE